MNDQGVISIRFSADDYAQVQAAAEDGGQSIGAYAKDRVLDAARAARVDAERAELADRPGAKSARLPNGATVIAHFPSGWGAW